MEKLYLFLICGAFLGLMDTVIFVSLVPEGTIKLLEALKLYPKGKLQSSPRDYVDGKGMYVNRRCYVMVKNGQEHFENGRVFLYMLLIYVPVFTLLGYLIYEFYGKTLSL
jgi:hypothetical protein